MKSMIYLTFDSNIWVYLLDNSWTASNPLDHLEHWIKEKHVKILVPDIIITEWDKLKEKQRELRVKKIREFFNMAQEIIPTAFIDQYNKPDNLERIVDDQFERIETLIGGLCDKIVIEDSIRLKSVQRTLDKLAPNHKKNSLADTLIILSLIEFATQNPGHEYLFISNNTEDFYEKLPDRSHQIHSDLKPDFDKFNIKESRFLDPVIEDLKKRLPVAVDLSSIRRERIKVKLEQQIYNPAVSSSLTSTKDGYLENIATLDLILPRESPTTQQVLFVLNLIESDDSYAYYFFRNCKTHVWFQILIDRGTFKPSHNPGPVAIGNGGYTIPLWSPMMYLLTLVSDNNFTNDSARCKKLIDILEDICKNPKDNNRTWYFLIQILEKLPNDLVPETILEYIPVWLSGSFDYSMISSLLCKELLIKFCPENPSLADYRKVAIIIKHLFSLQKSERITRNNNTPDEYFSPVYLYYLAEVPDENRVIRQLIAGNADWMIGYICEKLNQMLLDYRDGISTIINEGSNRYRVEAIIEGKDVIIKSFLTGTNNAVQISRLPGFYYNEEKDFTTTIIEVLKNHGINYVAEENKDYNLETLRVRLFHGKSYEMDNVPIHKLEANDDKEDGLLSIFSLMLIKLLLEYDSQFPLKTNSKLEQLWENYRLPLFRRVILFTTGKTWPSAQVLFDKLLTIEKAIFSVHDYEKELYWLLSTIADSFSTNEKNLLEKIISDGPSGESREIDLLYIEHWQLQWYAALKSLPEFKLNYETLSAKLNITADKFENKGEVIVRSGSVSPYTVEEILKKPNEEIVSFIENFNPTDRWEEPNIDGMAERLGKAVETDPTHFAPHMRLYKNVYYIYIYYMLNGFREAWKKKLHFDWEKLIEFCYDYINQPRFSTKELRLSSDSWGADDEWVAGSIATLLTSGLQSDDHAFSANLLPQAKEILMKLGNQLNPPKEIRRDNMDYPTYSLNSTAGKVLRALFDYSLRRARLYLKADDPNKWEPEIKALFEQTLQKGIIDGYILQGMYFSHFYWLDKEWINQQITVNLEVEESKWEAFMGGFMFGRAPNSKEVYHAMYPHYERAIAKNMVFSRMNERTIVNHLVSYYFWGYETLSEQKLVYQFLKKTSGESVQELIGFMARQDKYYETLQGEEKKEFEGKILAVWKMVVNRFCDAAGEEDKKTLSSAAGLLSLTPELNNEVTELTIVSLKDMTEYYHWHGIIDDLIRFGEQRNSPEVAENIGKILVKSTALPLHTNYESEKMKKLVVYLYENGQKETANQICDTVSRQGHSFLREVYNKYNQ